jgi:hypothetical protein
MPLSPLAGPCSFFFAFDAPQKRAPQKIFPAISEARLAWTFGSKKGPVSEL